MALELMVSSGHNLHTYARYWIDMENSPQRLRGIHLLSEALLETIFGYLDNPQDRSSISMVCKQWYRIEGFTRSHVHVANCYSIHPWMLIRRFPNLRSLKLKGKPRAYEFKLLPEKWGGYAKPWVQAIVSAYRFMTCLHFRRAEILDDDLQLLANSFKHSLQVLMLHKCSGYSTSGLHAITRSCRLLRVLFLEESIIIDNGGEWLHELAENNSRLEVLSFAMTSLEHVSMEDLQAILQRCGSLTVFKVSVQVNINVRRDLSSCNSLKELAILFSVDDDDPVIPLPRNLTSLSGDIQLPVQEHTANNLTKLDLLLSELPAEGQNTLLRSCPNLDDLQARNIIGDDGLLLVAGCRNLRRIRIEEQGDDQAFVSHVGLTAIAQSCFSLQKLHIYVSDIKNAALVSVGQHCRNLLDFRLILTDNVEEVSELPLDNGISSLLQGCSSLLRLCVYLRRGGLTNVGMARIGQFGRNLKALLLGCVGESDQGFLDLANGCQNLERLEIRDCPFTERGLTRGVLAMRSLKFIWAQGYLAEDKTMLLSMCRSWWNIEYSESVSVQFHGYRTLAGPRTDCPPDVIDQRQLALLASPSEIIPRLFS